MKPSTHTGCRNTGQPQDKRKLSFAGLRIEAGGAGVPKDTSIVFKGFFFWQADI